MRNLLGFNRFTVEEYRRMGETGIFREDDRVELIEAESGYQVTKPADISRPITLPGIAGTKVDLTGLF